MSNSVTRDVRALSAYHEASHAITAMALGVAVNSAMILSDGRGLVTHALTTPRNRAIISVAGFLAEKEQQGFDFDRDRYSNATDLTNALDCVGSAGLWLAEREARLIIAEHRRDIADLAGQLHRLGSIRWQ